MKFMKRIPLVMLAMLVIAPSFSVAQWWNPFEPKNLEDCILEGTKAAKTSEAVDAVIMACEGKFPPKSRVTASALSKAELQRKLKKCGLEDGVASMLAIKNFDSRRQAIRKLKGLQVVGNKVWLQNSNAFPVGGIGVGFTTSKSCSENPSDYDAVFICWGSIGSNLYGELQCPTEIDRFTRTYGRCVIGIAPPVPKSGLYVEEVDKVGLCER
jgi:hypothetical protein